MPVKCSNPACPLTQAITIIGGKWKTIIISQLHPKRKRFGQIHAAIPGISKKVLTSQLNQMLEDELITRHSYDEVPPRVEYGLTDRAKELLPILLAISRWGMYLVENPDEDLVRKLKLI